MLFFGLDREMGDASAHGEAVSKYFLFEPCYGSGPGGYAPHTDVYPKAPGRPPRFFPLSARPCPLCARMPISLWQGVKQTHSERNETCANPRPSPLAGGTLADIAPKAGAGLLLVTATVARAACMAVQALLCHRNRNRPALTALLHASQASLTSCSRLTPHLLLLAHVLPLRPPNKPATGNTSVREALRCGVAMWMARMETPRQGHGLGQE